MSNPLRVHLVRKIPVPRQAVFEAWLDSKRLVQFMKPAPGMIPTVQKVDPRVGGGFEFIFLAGETRIPIRGDYTAIDRFDRLAFTWLDPMTLPTSLVTLTFEEAGPRSTKLTLDHAGFPDQAACTSHDDGWGQILQSLEHVLAA
ncbi:MAG TPA: SRPBCC domain-containing protein [bacterium]